MKHGVVPRNIALAIASGLSFKAVDEKGNLFDGDRLFHEREIVKGFDHVMKAVCGLEDAEMPGLIRDYYERIRGGSVALEAVLSGG
jgi:hypothetical protein